MPDTYYLQEEEPLGLVLSMPLIFSLFLTTILYLPCKFCLLKYYILPKIEIVIELMLLPVWIQMLDWLLLLVLLLLYHAWNTDRLQIIFNNYFFLSSVLVLTAADEKKRPVGNGRWKKLNKRVTLFVEYILKISKNFFFFLCHCAVCRKSGK